MSLAVALIGAALGAGLLLYVAGLGLAALLRLLLGWM